MAKKGRNTAVLQALSFTEPVEPDLKRQSRYSRRPWQPGEIPCGPLITNSRPHDASPRYDEGGSVELPKQRGKGKP